MPYDEPDKLISPICFGHSNETHRGNLRGRNNRVLPHLKSILLNVRCSHMYAAKRSLLYDEKKTLQKSSK